MRCGVLVLCGFLLPATADPGTYLSRACSLGVPSWGGPILRTTIFWGLYWGPLFLGKLPNLDSFVRCFKKAPDASSKQ